jgi:hypothetical protein
VTAIPENPCSAPRAAERTLDLISWGVPFRLAAGTPGLLESMRPFAPFGSRPSGGPPAAGRTFSLRRSHLHSSYQVLGDGQLLAEDSSLDLALEMLGGQLMAHVAEQAPDYVFVHAGVVAWQDRALLLPAPSFAGKSTLVAELVSAGATYYSDELALIDSNGLVHPFARDLQMRSPGKVEQTPLSIKQLRGNVGNRAIPAALVVFTEYASGARWAPERLSAGCAVLEMLRHAAPLRRTPARVLATFSAVMAGAAAWRSQRGEAAVAASALFSALATGKPLV